MFRLKLEERTLHLEQHLQGLGVAKRIERRTAIVALEELSDRHIEEPCDGEELACRDPVLTVLELVYLFDS